MTSTTNSDSDVPHPAGVRYFVGSSWTIDRRVDRVRSAVVAQQNPRTLAHLDRRAAPKALLL